MTSSTTRRGLAAVAMVAWGWGSPAVANPPKPDDPAGTQTGELDSCATDDQRKSDDFAIHLKKALDEPTLEWLKSQDNAPFGCLGDGTHATDIGCTKLILHYYRGAIDVAEVTDVHSPPPAKPGQWRSLLRDAYGAWMKKRNDGAATADLISQIYALTTPHSQRVTADYWAPCSNRYGVADSQRFQRQPRTFLLCVDATHGPAVTWVGNTWYHQMLPQQRLDVRVLTGTDVTVGQWVEGVFGAFEPQVRDDTVVPGGPEKEPPPVTTSSATMAVYPTLMPGTHTLHVRAVTKTAQSWQDLRQAVADARALVATAHQDLATQRTTLTSALDKLLASIEKQADTHVPPQMPLVDDLTTTLRAVDKAQADVASAEKALTKARADLTAAEKTKGTGKASTEKDAVVKAADDVQTNKDLLKDAISSAKDAFAAATATAAASTTVVEAADEWPELKYPVVVDRTYTGSIRLGAALAVGGAASQDLDVLENDGAYRLAQRDRDVPLETELIVGYTQFFSRRPWSAASFRVGASGAMGIASITDQGAAEITAFRSMYLGLDLGWNGFSIAPSFAVRKVDRFKPGYAVGDIVATGDRADYLRPTVGVGFGLVAYFTPQLFKASSARQPAAATPAATVAGVTP